MIDQKIVLSIVWTLGGIAFILSLGIVWIAAHGQQIDAGLSGLDGSCLGAIGGLLTNLRKSDAPAPPPAATSTTEPLSTDH